MDSVGLLQGLIAPRLPDAAQVQRQYRRARLAFFLSLLLFVPVFLFVAFIFASAWSAASWGDFFNSNLLPALGTLWAAITVVDRLSGFLRKAAQRREQALFTVPLREAARAASENVAPLAEEQPEREARPGMASWGPLMQPLYGAYAVVKAIGLALLIVGLIFLFIFGLALLLAVFGSDASGPRVEIIGSLISGAFCLCTLPIFLWARRMPRTFDVQADDWHLEWRRLRWQGASRQTTRMPWHEARAFSVFTFQQKSGVGKLYGRYRVYVLDGEQTALAWSVRDGRDAVATATAASDAFCRLVASHTRLPLRNISGEVERLAERIERKPVRKKKDVPLSLQALQEPERERPLPPFKWPYLRYVFLLPLALFGLLAGVGWSAQAYQSHQYEALLAQVHTHKPLYHDALSAPTGDWPVQGPNANDPRSYSYVNHAYQLIGDYFTVALAPPFYRDMAVEVTVGIRGGSEKLGDTWLGLALHMDDQGNGLLFQVNPVGYWSIGTFDDSDFHHSNTLNVIKNRLTVIMRGDDYICYANDHFIGLYHSSLYPAGLVGVFLGSPNTIAAFTDFTIYPL